MPLIFRDFDRYTWLGSPFLLENLCISGYNCNNYRNICWISAKRLFCSEYKIISGVGELGTCLYLPVYLFQELLAQRLGHSVSGWRSAPVQDRNTAASLLLFPKMQTVSSVDVQTTKWGNFAVFSGLLHECISFFRMSALCFSAWVLRF